MTRVILSYNHNDTEWTIQIISWEMSTLLNTIVNDTEHAEDIIVDIPFTDTSLREALRVNRSLNDMNTITYEYEHFGKTTNNPDDLWNTYCKIRGCAHRILNSTKLNLYKYLCPNMKAYILSKNIIHVINENRLSTPFYFYAYMYNKFCKYYNHIPYSRFTLECLVMTRDEYMSVCKEYKERPLHQKYMIYMKKNNIDNILLNVLQANPKFDIQKAWYIYECSNEDHFPRRKMLKLYKSVSEKGTPKNLKWLTDTFPSVYENINIHI